MGLLLGLLLLYLFFVGATTRIELSMKIAEKKEVGAGAVIGSVVDNRAASSMYRLSPPSKEKKVVQAQLPLRMMSCLLQPLHIPMNTKVQDRVLISEKSSAKLVELVEPVEPVEPEPVGVWNYFI